MIARFLRTPWIDFTVPSLTGLGDRHYDTVKELQDEVGDARIWGGIHYRTAVKDGIAIGKQVTQLRARQPLPPHAVTALTSRCRRVGDPTAPGGTGATRTARHLPPDRHRSPTGPSVGLMSMIGVPSRASRSLTVSVDPSIEVTVTR